MPLLAIWRTNPTAVASLSVEQVVATAGDGRLFTDTKCSKELREYLSQVPSAKLSEYAEHCLSSPFTKSGHVLQDIVNELGRRLDYSVKNGLYQGTKTSPGFDGFWRSPEGDDFIVEVKTTDTYRIALDTIAAYRKRLKDDGAASAKTYMLLIVGREDTGELEAQIRGSRHAWEMRLISVDALMKLVKLKESTESPATGTKIRGVLVPTEYTKLDALIDVMFAAAQDVESSADIEQRGTLAADADGAGDASGWQFTDPDVLQEKREQVVAAFAQHSGVKLIQMGRARYWDAEHQTRVVCTVSKRYLKRGHTPYWYAFHPRWNEFLNGGRASSLILGCMDLNVAFAIPFEQLRKYMNKLNVTVKKDGERYWHLKIVAGNGGAYLLQLPRAKKDVPLMPFKLATA